MLKPRILFSLGIALLGAAGFGALVSMQPVTDPIVTGSNRLDAHPEGPQPRPFKAKDMSTPNPSEVRAFFDQQLKQVRSR
jgi:DMSO/TMAO reductase YedYZ molybdopterin-dependent catalytic subunit